MNHPLKIKVIELKRKEYIAKPNFFSNFEDDVL